MFGLDGFKESSKFNSDIVWDGSERHSRRINRAAVMLKVMENAEVVVFSCTSIWNGAAISLNIDVFMNETCIYYQMINSK